MRKRTLEKIPRHVKEVSLDLAATPWQTFRRILPLSIPGVVAGTFHLLKGLGHLSLVGYQPDDVNSKSRSIIEAEMGS